MGIQCPAAQDFKNGNATIHFEKIVSTTPIGLKPWISGILNDGF